MFTRGEAPVPEPKVRSPPVDMMEERREEGAAVIIRELYMYAEDCTRSGILTLHRTSELPHCRPCSYHTEQKFIPGYKVIVQVTTEIYWKTLKV